MQEYQVTCIVKPHPQSAHEHITHIGNLEQKWMLTREAAIARIDAKQEAFFVANTLNNTKAYVGVVREAGNAPYLRTHANGHWNDNLLAQRQCDGSCKLIA